MERVVIETMPTHLREGHKAAANSGVWPHNGAKRFAVERAEAEMMVESDPEWTSILDDEDPDSYETR